MCLAAFYLTWAWLVVSQNMWGEVVAHWPISLAMAIGSYAAGSTPMGGGTVGFPVLVLFFDQPASLGRDFSFAIQSIGMVSASIFILVRKQKLATTLLYGAILGALLGTPAGIFYISPHIPDLWVKLTFSVIWASFGVLHLYRIGEISTHTGMTAIGKHWDFVVGILLGVFSSATMAAVTGVGIDMVVYAALVLLCRADLKIAIPTSVIIMAFTSLLGISIKGISQDIQPEVYANWLAAAPVVALGAPLGVFVVEKMGRKPILLFVAVLCVGQFIWTCVSEKDSLGISGTLLSLAIVGACILGFEKLRSWGILLTSRHDHGKMSQEAKLSYGKTLDRDPV